MITKEKIREMMDDIGIRPDMVPHMPFLALEASKHSFVIELGVEYGNGSTKALAEGLRNSDAEDKLMISIDIEDKMTKYRIPTENWWKFILGDDVEATVIDKVKELANGRKADIIFVDSFHDPDHITKELNAYFPLTDDNTVWYFHDVIDNISGEEQNIVQPIKDFAAQNNLTYEVVSTKSCGLGKLYKK
ncbi:MAG TPA: class I SAM-dependent methyltransferase [Bacteroidales bacterium]|nr:class I SAM-dependent methyltransferase [Bacteroidales bacterium]